MLVNITFIQHYVVGSYQCTKIRKQNKSYKSWKRRKFSTCRQNYFVCINIQKIMCKLLDLRWVFRLLARFSIAINN